MKPKTIKVRGETFTLTPDVICGGGRITATHAEFGRIASGDRKFVMQCVVERAISISKAKASPGGAP